ncbi:pectate lyase [Reichenbachiella ulvae]|uniref:Pectate lyase n=1 Tax=Reichenbachiella ulvae TaxID=2980104 RepID=A0ABT3CZS8_9BACT|nr:pectate lyase [Reichenbachiella ulvae]MCV9389084.1 pectate lyase [Reichenbachiella ulvae]
MTKYFFPQALIVLVSALFSLYKVNAQDTPMTWRQALRQEADWYGSPEALRIADQVLIYQHPNGGWAKNVDMAAPLDAAQIKAIKQEQSNPDSDLSETTIDNGATHTEMRFLARVYERTGEKKYKKAFLKGLDYLLEAQYDNGGWPQFYPLKKGYYENITFNDGAMMGVMWQLRQVVDGAYDFVDPTRIKRAKEAIDKGLEVILKMQVKVNAELTVWCAQHDPVTLAPAKARAYEHISLSGSESVGILKYLMSIDNPSPEVIAAVKGAVAWFEKVKLTDVRIIRKEDDTLPRGFDKLVAFDPMNAEPLWARFYEIGTNYPIFSDRRSIVLYSLSEISYERRVGYRWFGSWPQQTLVEDYPKWCEKWGVQ